MTELRKLWYIMDTNGIAIRPRYINTAANVWADRLSRELDRDDWALNNALLNELAALWGPCTIDRFASMENALLPRYNARWRDPRCEAVDSLHLPDLEWLREHNWCNPP